jgi:uncharacterized protein with HEPN domain
MLDESDSTRLRHMLDAARKAVRFAAGRSRDELENDDDPLADALVHLVSLIGEAANQVSPATQTELDDVPWSDVIGMRNRLIHAYFDINLDILWATVQYSLPSLIASLSPILSESEPD